MDSITSFTIRYASGIANGSSCGEETFTGRKKVGSVK